MRQQQMAQMRATVRQEQVKRLFIGKVSPSAADPSFQVVRITAVFQHIRVIIRFQESRMALPEVVNQLLAGSAQIGENPYGNLLAGHRETVRFSGVMDLRKRPDQQLPDPNFLKGGECPDQVILDRNPAVPVCIRGDVDGQLVFFGQYRYSANVVRMLVGYEDRFYLFHGQPQPVPLQPHLKYEQRHLS